MKTDFLKLLSLTPVAAMMLMGCDKSANGDSLLPTGQSFTQSAASVSSNKIDVLWVVDNSGSMSPAQTNLVNNFRSFITKFQAKGFDFQIAVTTSDAYVAAAQFNNTPAYAKFRDGVGNAHTGFPIITPATPNLLNVFVSNATQGTSGSGDERAFSSFKTALNSSLNSGFIRPNSFLSVIIVSDEDDFSDPNRREGSWTFNGGIPDHSYTSPGLETVSSYVSYLDTLTGSTPNSRHFNVSAITIADNACLTSYRQQSPGAIMGTRYMDLVSQTAGVVGSLCDASYANSLDFISQRISELSTQFRLNRLPVVSSIVVVVNGSFVTTDAANGWTYDSTQNSIVFHGTAIPSVGSTIQVNFDPQNVQI